MVGKAVHWKPWSMTSSQQWPLLNQATQTQTRTRTTERINEAERDGAERFLHQALRDGRLSIGDFEARFTAVMNASRTGQLHSAMAGIAPVGQALARVQDRFGLGTQRPMAARMPTPPQSLNSGAAALAHFSGLFSWVIGPAVIYAASPQGSFARREAAKAFNYQLVAGFSFLAVAIVLGGILGLGGAVALAWLAWVGLTIFGGARALAGDDWENPLNRVTRVHALPTDGR